MRTTVFRLWTRGFPDPKLDSFGRPESTMATVSVEPAEDCWGPMLCINTHDEELTPKHNYVVQFNYSEELDEFIARLQAARDAWEEDPS